MQPDGPPPEHEEPRGELLLALGRLVFEFGLLDEALHDALWMATDRRDDTRVLTSGLRFLDLVDRFEALYAGFADPLTGARGVRALCAELRTLNSDRNREIRAVWGFWAETGRPLRQQHRLKRGAIALSMESSSRRCFRRSQSACQTPPRRSGRLLSITRVSNRAAASTRSSPNQPSDVKARVALADVALHLSGEFAWPPLGLRPARAAGYAAARAG